MLRNVSPARNGDTEADHLVDILESTPDCIAIMAADGRVTYVNSGGCRLLGVVCPETIIGSSFLDFVHADSENIVLRAARQAERSRRGQSCEIDLRCCDGRVVTVSQTILVHRDEAGEVVRYSTIIRNLDRRVAAERQLASREQRFRTLYNATPVMLHSLDAEGRLESVNDHWLETLGYRREEVIGCRLPDLFTPESRTYAETTAIPEFWRTGHLRDVPYRVVRGDGSVLDVLLSADALHDEDGAIIGGLAVMVDVTERRRLEADYRDIFQNASEGIYRSTPEGRLLQVNPALARMHGFRDEDELVSAVSDIAHDWYVDPDARSRLQSVLTSSGRIEGFVAEIRRVATGERVLTSENVRAVRDDSGNIRYYEGTVRDISEQHRAETLGRARGEILELIARRQGLTDILDEIVRTVEQQFEALSAGVFRLIEGELRAAAVPRLSGTCIGALDRNRPSAVGTAVGGAMQTVRALSAGLDDMDPHGELYAAMRISGHGAVIAVPIRDQRDAVLGFLIAFAAGRGDLTPAVVELLAEMAQIASIAFEQDRLADELLRQAHYDSLTNLPNRNLLNDRLLAAIREAERDDTLVGVALLDLDEFKLINDTLGHSAGDDLLREVAQRLVRQIHGAETVARLGGDEFVLIVPMDEARAGERIAESVIAALDGRIRIADHEVTAHPSIGISVFPDDGTTPEALLKAADTAMYAAKHAGKNQYRFFAGTMNRQVTERLRIETELRRALDHDRLILHYQPRVDLGDGRTLGAEALLRWPRDDGGITLPGAFLPTAERTALIGDVDRYVLERAVHTLAHWQAGRRNLVLSVNLSAYDLHSTGFSTEVAGLLSAHGVDPGELELEITESMLMQDFEGATRQLRDLKERAPGVRIAIDDFGSGYSSLSYLRHLPIDTLKIDRSFVADLDEADNRHTASAIVRTMVELGRNLGLNVVAEGVENESQAMLLRDLGCHEAQGFLFDHPLSFEVFEQRLA